MTPTIEQQLASVLMPLVDERAYPITLPQNTKYPAVTWHRMESKQVDGENRAGLLPVRSYGRKSVYQVVVWAKHYSDCVKLLRNCKKQIETTIKGMYLDEVSDGFEHELQLYTVIQEYVIWSELETHNTGGVPESPISKLLNSVKKGLGDDLEVPVFAKQESGEKTGVVLDIETIQRDEQAGDGRFALTCTFSAHCVSPSKTEAAWLAGKVLRAVEYNKWGLAGLVGFPDRFTSQFVYCLPYIGSVWQVMWQQVIFTGSCDSIPEIKPPDGVYAGESPKTGNKYQDQYVPIV